MDACARAEEKAGPPVMFLDHPSRRASSIAAVAKQLEFLADAGDGVFVGVEGAPGHQKATPLGAYDGAMTPEDRWDPSIATPGAAWDQQLMAGRALTGALATSDFHSESNGDYWPCEFSATWIYARERSAVGVLEALRAGSFVGVHGGIARDVHLSLASEGLPAPGHCRRSREAPERRALDDRAPRDGACDRLGGTAEPRRSRRHHRRHQQRCHGFALWSPCRRALALPGNHAARRHHHPGAWPPRGRRGARSTLLH